MTPRPNVSKERKEQILQAALRVFSQSGFHKARMDDIAEESGLSKGALYLYFRGKDDIIEALLDYLFAYEMRDLERLAQEHDRPVPARLRELAHAIIASMKLVEPVLPVMYEFYALATRPGRIRNALQKYYHRYRDALAAMLAEGVARGELRPVDVRAAATALIAQFEGLLLLWVISPDLFDLAEVWLSAAEHFVQGLERFAN